LNYSPSLLIITYLHIFSFPRSDIKDTASMIMGEKDRRNKRHLRRERYLMQVRRGTTIHTYHRPVEMSSCPENIVECEEGKICDDMVRPIAGLGPIRILGRGGPTVRLYHLSPAHRNTFNFNRLCCSKQGKELKFTAHIPCNSGGKESHTPY
jgi:hypothetical protein